MNSGLLKWVWLAAYTAGCAYFVFFVERSSFVALSLVFALLFVLYGWAVYRSSRFQLKEILAAALVLRLLFFLGMPELSDDYNRFLWDGQLVQEGANPYLHLPSDYQSSQAYDYVGARYFAEMNSPDYYSVYPPLKQAIFTVSAQVAQGNPERGVLALRVILLLSELLFLWTAARLLSAFNLPVGRLVLYAFHPLVLVEVIGNVHFEGVVLLFLGLALLSGVYAYAADHQRAVKFAWWLSSGFFFGCAVMVKLTPLLLLPLIVVLLRRISRLTAFAIGALGISVLITIPFLDAELPMHFQSSLGLYFRTFEFNASVYYIVRAIGRALVGYNPIALLGPVLSLVSALLIAFLAVRVLYTSEQRDRNVFGVALLSWVVFLLFATTVHPWYLVILVGFSMFYLQYAVLLWTCTVVLSYSHYRNGGFEEHYLTIAIEYAVPLAAALIFSLNSSSKNQLKI